MAIGKYCQITGEKRKSDQVVAEVRGITVTTPALMNVVLGEHPLSVDQAVEKVKFCAVCGTEQTIPLNLQGCVSCGSPLTSKQSELKLGEITEQPAFSKRITAFLIDILIILLILIPVIFLINYLDATTSTTMADAGEGSEVISFFDSLKIISFFLIMIMYHSVLTWLLNTTPGKMIFGMKVALKNGSYKISFLRALKRGVLYLFTLYVIPIGLLPLLFQDTEERWIELIEKDAMYHNSLTDTVVIKPKM